MGQSVLAGDAAARVDRQQLLWEEKLMIISTKYQIIASVSPDSDENKSNCNNIYNNNNNNNTQLARKHNYYKHAPPADPRRPRSGPARSERGADWATRGSPRSSPAGRSPPATPPRWACPALCCVWVVGEKREGCGKERGKRSVLIVREGM